MKNHLRASAALLLVALAFAPHIALAQSATQTTAAGTETRLSSLEDQMRALNGQLEQLSFSIRRIDQSMQRMQTDYDARLSKLESEVTTLSTPPPPAPVVNPVAPDGTLGALKTQDGQVVGAVNSPQAPALPQAPADYGLTAQEEYDRAFGLLRQANYDEAEKAFQSFIDKFPKDKMIDNAKYWHAETLYVRGKFLEAAAGFADAYQQNPQGPKAPDSLLKLAMALGALNKTSDACTALSQLKAKYPGAPANVRTRAAEEHDKLKCQG